MTPQLLAVWAAELPAAEDLPPVFETRLEDREESELARVEQIMRRKLSARFGDDVNSWPGGARYAYFSGIAAVHYSFHGTEVAA